MIEKMIGATIVENAIERALRLDPRVAEKLAPLDGRKIRIQLDSAPRPWTFEISRGRLVFCADETVRADVCLRGTLGGFLRMFRSAEKGAQGNDTLYIEGDLHTAQQFQRVMADLAPDFHGVLLERFGDRLGGLLAEALKQLQRQGETARALIEARIRAILGEQGGAALAREVFGAHELRLKRLHVRLDELTARLDALETP